MAGKTLATLVQEQRRLRPGPDESRPGLGQVGAGGFDGCSSDRNDALLRALADAANGLEDEVEKKISKIYQEGGWTRPRYSGELPNGNDGLGVMLLGMSGDQVLEREVYEKIKEDTLSTVRGTVQADILKEDQAQNTCIFSIEFALRMMGDIQQYFISNRVRNFYSVSPGHNPQGPAIGDRRASRGGSWR